MLLGEGREGSWPLQFLAETSICMTLFHLGMVVALASEGMRSQGYPRLGNTICAWLL